MFISKIGSVNTYTKCLKELHAWGYIRYEPSFNPQRGSKVYLYRFDKGDDKGGDNASGNAGEQPVRPSKNNTNKANHKTYYEPANENSDTHNGGAIQEAQAADQNSGSNGLPGAAPDYSKGMPLPKSHKEVTQFFEAQGSTQIEAEKFFNYFQSNGWKVGGRAPMKDWQAAARNWILNASKFQPAPKPSPLHASTNKNYNEPL